MSEQEEAHRTRVATAFNKVLNTHGYGFHYSMLEKLNELYDKSRSLWYFEAAEFPVEVNGHGTRVDLILRRTASGGFRGTTPFFLLAECKRVNPALGNWCFIKAPYTHRNTTVEPYTLERATTDDAGRLSSYAKSRMFIENAYHIAVEVRTEEKGDQAGSGRGAIEDAATQICRGLNGFVSFLATHTRVLGDYKMADFLPVIFTTANIWASDGNLGKADLQSGNVDLSLAGFKRQDWIILQYHMSPGLRHSLGVSTQSHDLGDILEQEYIRSIPIVTPNGLESFLRWASNIELAL